MSTVFRFYYFSLLCSGIALAGLGCQQNHTGIVGSKAFTESVILAEILQGLTETTGQAVIHRQEIGGTRMMWEALLAGEIDFYPEYTGTIRQEIFSTAPFLDEAQLQKKLAQAGIAIGPRLGFNNSYALGMQRKQAEALGIRTISDLAAHPELRLGFSNEFLQRGDGWPSLQQTYALPHRNVRGLEHTLAYQALNNSGLDVIDVYTTDPQIPQYDLLLLADDREHFPSYEAVVLYRQKFAQAHPEILQPLERLAGKISAEAMARMNQQVQIAGLSEQQVAAEFLEQQFGVHTTVISETLPQRLLRTTGEHLWLVSVSLLAAILVAIPLGIVAYRHPWRGQLLLGFAEAVQTIPGLALLILIGLLFVKLGWPMISPWPVIVALFLYSLLPILRNTVAGLASIPQGLRESAVALGMSPRAQLWRIELPLASPLILAGIKTTAVINIGYAALGGLIGAGGYGQPIIAGLRLNNTALMLEGAIPAAVLAVLVKFFFSLLEPYLIPRGLRLPTES